MPYDVVEANRQATQAGTALGAVISNRVFREQELQSKAAYQRLQEQEIAQRLKYAMEAHDQMVQQRAEIQKANARYELMNTPTIPVASGTGVTMQMPNPAYNPNQGLNFFNAYKGLARDEEDISKLAVAAGTLQYRQASTQHQQALAENVGKPRPLAPEQVAATEALTHQREAAAKLSETKQKEIEDGKTRQGVEPEVFRMINQYEARTGKRMSDEEVKDAIDYRLGLKARPPVEHKISKSDYITRHLRAVMEQDIIPSTRIEKGGLFSKDKEVATRRRPTREEAIKYLSDEYDMLPNKDLGTEPNSTTTQTPRVRKYNPATGMIE